MCDRQDAGASGKRTGEAALTILKDMRQDKQNQDRWEGTTISRSGTSSEAPQLRAGCPLSSQNSHALLSLLFFKSFFFIYLFLFFGETVGGNFPVKSRKPARQIRKAVTLKSSLSEALASPFLLVLNLASFCPRFFPNPVFPPLQMTADSSLRKRRYCRIKDTVNETLFLMWRPQSWTPSGGSSWRVSIILLQKTTLRAHQVFIHR